MNTEYEKFMSQIDLLSSNFKKIFDNVSTLSDYEFFIFKYIYGNLSETLTLLQLLNSDNKIGIKDTSLHLKSNVSEYLRYLIIKELSNGTTGNEMDVD